MAEEKNSKKKPMTHLEYIAKKDKAYRARVAKEEKEKARKQNER